MTSSNNRREGDRGETNFNRDQNHMGHPYEHRSSGGGRAPHGYTQAIQPRRSVQAVLARPGQDEAVAILFVKHDNSYKTVAFGETVIKEMFFSSIYPNVRISKDTSMKAYQVMCRRIERVAAASPGHPTRAPHAQHRPYRLSQGGRIL